MPNNRNMKWFGTVLSIVLLFGRVDAAFAENTDTIKVLRAAAEKGDDTAQVILGMVYLKGTTVPEDHAEAVKWFRLAADHGSAEAQVELGRLYHSGLGGLPIDNTTAFGLFYKAAAQGNEGGIIKVAEAYCKGFGVSPQQETAIQLLNAWAEKGLLAPQEELAKIYAKGTCAPKDKLKAYMWYTIAMNTAARNHFEVIDTSPGIEGLSKEDTQNAQTMADLWLKSHPATPSQ
jgi:TPR repeat protein